MKVKFIKDHIVGIKEGAIFSFSDDHAKRLIAEGYCIEQKETRGRKKIES